ncbi:MFS general substrate transporter [Auriscalpium vulgare]|uniref:MFS general substrate transporter n=1 Tax=Auriscalpium vulgare TaxID=40419 RepID=A0ACB8S5X3_9AGAM|nr:MFS general substrate transporter [Auriscalpium vulgare]
MANELQPGYRFEDIHLEEFPPASPITERAPRRSPSISGSVFALEQISVSSVGNRNETVLAPVDTGFAAWAFLAAAFVVEGLVFSVPYAYGIFLPLYLEDPRFASPPHAATLLPLVGTLSSGVIFLTGPIVYPYLSRYPHHRRICAWLGVLLWWTSVFGASYADKIEHLLVLQGVMFGISGSMLYAATISYFAEWFVKRRGLANGIMFTGSASGGLILPFILPPVLRAHGTSTTLRFLSVALVLLLLPAVPFLRPRLPESRVHGPRRRTDQRSWMKDWLWWALIASNTIVGLGFFLPQLWFPTFASALNLSTSSSSLALALLNGASALAPLFVGFLSDRYSPWIIALFVTSSSSIFTFILWGVVGNAAAGMMAYGVAYGLSAGGWSTLWSGFIRGFSKDDPDLATLLYGFLMLSRGIGNVLSSPISTTLLSGTNSTQFDIHSHGKTGFAVQDGRFGRLITYVGSCFAAAGVVSLVVALRDKRSRRA